MGCHAALLGLLSLVVGLASTKGNVPPLPAGQLAGYLTYDQTLHYLQELHAAAPGLVGEPQVIGSSVENRDIPAICIGRCDGEGGKALFTALHHSREVSGAGAKRGWHAMTPPPFPASHAACGPGTVVGVHENHSFGCPGRGPSSSGNPQSSRAVGAASCQP